MNPSAAAKLDKALVLIGKANEMERQAYHSVMRQGATLRDFEEDHDHRMAFAQRIHGMRLEASVLAIAAQLESSREPADE